MKSIFYCLSLLSIFLLMTCNSDDDNPQDPNVLQYDGENVTGPLLPPGTHEAAVLFPASLLADFVGRGIEDIEFFIGVLPDACAVKIYGEGTGTEPGSLLYAVDVSNGINAPSWNALPINPPLDITGEDLWISIEVTHTSQQQSIGCDAGPNVTNGDWLYLSTDNDWSPYITRTSESINWNIRANLTIN